MPKDMQTSRSIPADAKWVRAVDVYESNRWPIKRDTFYRMVRDGLIVKHFPIVGGQPAYSVAQIDALFEQSAQIDAKQ